MRSVVCVSLTEPCVAVTDSFVGDIVTITDVIFEENLLIIMSVNEATCVIAGFYDMPLNFQ